MILGSWRSTPACAGASSCPHVLQGGAFCRDRRPYKLPVWTAAKCAKLRGRYFGPFRVAAVHSPVAIELELPGFMQGVHPVVHPQYLKLATNRRQEPGKSAACRR